MIVFFTERFSGMATGTTIDIHSKNGKVELRSPEIVVQLSEQSVRELIEALRSASVERLQKPAVIGGGRLEIRDLMDYLELTYTDVGASVAREIEMQLNRTEVEKFIAGLEAAGADAFGKVL
ncbi:MAG: hypothetical protein ACRD3W_30595 [Terriglobales bacterium]